MTFNKTYMSKEELEELLKNKIDPIEINRIFSAYDMADMAYFDKKTINGTPYFFHTTRVCRILINELSIFDPDLLVSSLLHDVLKASIDISPEIIDYNFGPYVTYLLTILSEDINHINNFPIPETTKFQELRVPIDDYLIIWLAEHLDNFRGLDTSPVFNPINYILNTLSVHLPKAETSNNKYVKKLISELKKERNKILG